VTSPPADVLADDATAGAGPSGAREKLAAQDLEAEIRARGIAWEIGFSKFLLGISGMGAGLAITTWGKLGAELALPMLVLAIAVALYFATVWQLLERGLLGARSWAHWINATIQGSIATAVLIVSFKVKGPEWALTAPSILLYTVLIAASAVRMRPSLCLYVGAVSIVEYLALYYLAIAPAVSAEVVAALPTLEAWGVWHRAAWLGGCALTVAVATHRLRGLAIELGTEARRRRHLEREFGRYVSREVAEEILRGNADVGAAERREVAVLFCDLRDFTQLCEREEPEEMVALLNLFYGRACRIVEAHGGTVNKLLGDGLLALFGAPHRHPSPEVAAAGAAHEILFATRELRGGGGALSTLDVGIGLDSGPVVVGGIGATDRLEYTAIGSTVNRAARLQGLARDGEFRIILSAEFLARLGARASVVPMGKARLKGLSQPVEVFAFRHTN
jgi:class 3 adenylate cyclase